MEHPIQQVSEAYEGEGFGHREHCKRPNGFCDIQGRLFELSVERQLGSAAFIKAFMNSETAKTPDSTYNRMQWAGETGKAIYKQAPVETMKRNYLMFHTMAPEAAIEDLKEIGENEKRCKTRIKRRKQSNGVGISLLFVWEKKY